MKLLLTRTLWALFSLEQLPACYRQFTPSPMGDGGSASYSSCVAFRRPAMRHYIMPGLVIIALPHPCFLKPFCSAFGVCCLQNWWAALGKQLSPHSCESLKPLRPQSGWGHLWRSSCPTSPLLKHREHPKPVALYRVMTPFQYLQGWRLHSHMVMILE